jgi:hypothetical protein
MKPRFRARSEGGFDLQENRITTAYRVRLGEALFDLLLWCGTHHRPMPDDLLGDTAAINTLLIDYVQDLFDRSGRSKTGLRQARHAILALKTKHRHLRGSLRPAWDSVQSWQAVVPLQLRVPWDPLVVGGVFCHAMLQGFMLDRSRAHLWLPFGIGVLVMFFGMLRPGEFLRLDRQHVRVPADRPEAGLSHALLALVNPKNAAAMGRLQTVLIEDDLAVSWLEWLVTDLAEGARLFPSSGPKFRELLHLSLKDLGLSGLGLTPGGLRPGGATFRFRKGEEISRLRFTGRWRSLQSLEHYIQEVAASMVLMNMPKRSLKLLQKLSRHSAIFSKPPALPWPHFFARSRQLAQLRRWSRAGTTRFEKRALSGWDTDSSEDSA